MKTPVPDDVTDRLETGFGFGKVILLGEHAVVYGQPAIAAGIAAGVQAVATKGTGKLSVPAWDLSTDVSQQIPVARALAAIFEALNVSPMDVTCDAQIPAGSGLGSSAALAVAITRAASKYADVPEELQTKAVLAAESVFHQTPSGIDAAAASQGGLGVFSRAAGWKPLAASHAIELCVGLTGRPRQTGALVQAVKHLCDRTPVARRVIDTLGDVTRTGFDALAVGDIDTLGRLFDVAHGLLSALRVSSPETEVMVHAARGAGAIGAKLTGAGGGGAVIALAPGHSDHVLGAWKAAGFEGFTTTVGGPTKP
ncbi:MAG: mevalonate kinase [Deltaproteobacteria bacterium]|nr:mevalonate kinase [Deltaproteobacteria bacterium]